MSVAFVQDGKVLDALARAGVAEVAVKRSNGVADASGAMRAPGTATPSR